MARHDTDRLSAIQGLATRIHERLQFFGPASSTVGIYRYGIFDSDATLAPSVLWYVTDRSARPALSQAKDQVPSWSWGSVSSSIKNNCTTADGSVTSTNLTILDRRLSLRSVLRVRGKLRSATWRRQEPVEYYRGHHGALDKLHHLYHEQFIPISTDMTTGPEAHGIYDLSREKVGHFVPDTDEELSKSGMDSDVVTPGASEGQIFCLHIIVRPANAEDKEEFAIPWAARGLALIRSAAGADVYRRVGYIELSRTLPGKMKERGGLEARDVPDVDPRGFFKSCEETEIEIV